MTETLPYPSTAAWPWSAIPPAGPDGPESSGTVAARVSPAPPAVRLAGAKRRVLIVEDDPSSRRALRAILIHAGWDVAAVATVAEAVRKLDGGSSAGNGQGPVEWVVLDLMLPDGDGAAVLEYVRSRALPVRVTVTTGVSDPARLARIEQLRPHSLLRKPIDIAELLKSA